MTEVVRIRMSGRVAGIAVWATLALAAPAAEAEMIGLKITLFSPCSEEVAQAAADRLRAVPGVTGVDLVAGTLEMTVTTAADYTGDPLELAQLVWESKIYPNKIYLEARGRTVPGAAGLEFEVQGTGQRFLLRDSDATAASHDVPPGDVVRITAEVLDWIEDRQLSPGDRYTVRVVDGGQEERESALD